MAEWLTDIINWMGELPALWAYVVILGIAFSENVVPPVPGDMVVVFGGVLVGRGQLSLAVVVALATLGGAVGFMVVYAVGRKMGRVVLDPDRLTWIPQRQLEKAQRWTRRWGYGVVLANRFLSGARSVISLAVGMAQMNAWVTAACATASAAVWCSLIASAGYLVGDNWRIVSAYLRDYGRVVMALLVTALVVQGVRWWRSRQRADAA
jgi:membrane protein DedA with SNARE-associated domain